MAQIDFNPMIDGMHGRLCRTVIRKIRGKYYFHPKPVADPDREPTPAQLEFRRRFRLASDYAYYVQRTPELHDFYLPFAKTLDLRVRATAISDWFNPPKVESIDLSRYQGRTGDVIAIRATDEFGVIRVRVSIATADGQLEQGLAVLTGDAWLYTAQQPVPGGTAVKVIATAFDRPDQSGTLEANWPGQRQPDVFPGPTDSV